MKKILLILLLLVAAPAMATTICADDDVIAIVLDPTIAGNNHAGVATAFEWTVTFPYGAIWGIATCVDVAGVKNEIVNKLQTADGEIATGGERKGGHCWCQMTHPAISRWVYQGQYASTVECGSGCALNCGNYTSNVSAFRASMFESVPH